MLDRNAFLRPYEVPVEEGDPRRADHELLFEFQKSVRVGEINNDAFFEANELFRGMRQLPDARRAEMVELALARIEATKAQGVNYSTEGGLNAYYGAFPLTHLVRTFLEAPMELDAPQMERLLDAAVLVLSSPDHYSFPTEGLMLQLRQFEGQPEIMARWQPRLRELRQALSKSFISNVGEEYEYGGNAVMQHLAELIGAQTPGFLERGDAWADQVLADLDAMDEAARSQWRALLEHARGSKDSKPKAKWLKAADEHLEEVGKPAALQYLKAWFALYGKDDGWWFADREERNDAFFKGLVWVASRLEDAAIIPALGAALRGAFKARGRAGVRSLRVGNAAIWALGLRDESEAAAHLVGAKNRVKNGAVLKTLDKTIQGVATRAGMSAEDLEEIAVPDFGLEHGLLKRELGDASVEVEVSSGKATWRWTSGGKSVKAAPASVKRDFAGELKELKATVAEIEKVFAAQKERLDSLLRQEKSWGFATWKARYLDHPLLQVLAERLIWNFESQGQKQGEKQGKKVAAVPRGGGFINARGESVPVAEVAEVVNKTRVSLYHPLQDSAEDGLLWRRFFEEGGIRQPFKQAHREVYLLTDAERATSTYSNRFASHVLKQHQFNSLCSARGWKNALRLMVDDAYPPATKTWANHNLRAEFWIEGIGDDYGQDANEAGTFLRLSTDQVRFYRLDAPENTAHACGGGYSVGYRAAPTAALELEEVPPLLFSETMRDVDLFVGVSSLGADPNWSDGGPDGHFRNYWSNYSWGELSESAKSRADVLSRLLPRLKIRDRARIDGRFLRVEGKKRVYKIHLGSGNILMEPNDQYLCIVPGRSEEDSVFLPFEGDRTLAVILSKAFLLAEDDKIKDATITRQITPG